MKKTIVSFLYSVSLLIIFSCGNKTEKKQVKLTTADTSKIYNIKDEIDGVIKESSFTNKEKQLIRGISANLLYTFDFSIKNLYINHLEFWVDSYENGLLKKVICTVEKEIIPGRDSTGIFIFSVQGHLSCDTEKWVLSYGNIVNNSNITSTAAVNKLLNWGSTSNGKSGIVIDKIINLAVIEEGPSVANDLLNDTISNRNQIKNKDNTYILRCRFSHK